MSACNPFIADDFVFPRRPNNRPALPRIDYRVAAYPELVEAMLRRVNGAVELRAWTHRASDDPGIALLEGAAIVGDILTFYQERYANEAFLRTATWRDSIASLARLLGYRLAPGVGGRATFAFEVKGAAPVEIAAGLPVKADLATRTVDFLTSEACTAYAVLSRFHLYRARSYGAALAAGTTHIEVQSVAGSAREAAIDALALKKGDRLLLAPAEPTWTTAGSNFAAAQQTPQIAKVHGVTRQLGRTIVELEAPLAAGWTLPVTAYRLGRSWRHFGHTAPLRRTQSTQDRFGTITGATERDTRFMRHVLANHECSNTDASFNLPGEMIPLDQEVNDLVIGRQVAVQTTIRNGGSRQALTAVKTITALRTATIGFGSTTGPSTLLTMHTALTRNASLAALESDVRDYQVHEITSPPIALQPEATFVGASFASGEHALAFYGTQAHARHLAGRRLLLQRGADEPLALRCTSEATDFIGAAGTADEPRMWPVSFDRAPAPLTRTDFDERTPTVTVFGNLADATQGKPEPEIALGNGDGRARFQTFKLPKTPLTYLLSAGATPPQVPELDVSVAGRRWTRVDSLFGRGPAEEIYVVREDAEGTSWVQFGDGETGARLPSGVLNVSARYRSGNGAYGPLKTGTTPSVGRRIEGLDKVQLPGLVTGGADAEGGDRARDAAPGRIQSLGRMVSLRDYETEAITIPGVTTATAAWGLVDGVPTLTLLALLAGGREAEFAAVRTTVQRAQRCRGPDRFVVDVRQAFLRYVALDVQYAFDGRLVRDDVEAAIRAALGLAGDDATARTGLFGVRNRRIGAPEYATRVEGVVQQVAGVLWCRVTAFQLFPASVVDPAATPLPGSRTRHRRLRPADNQLVQLHAAHLTLASAPAPVAEACA